MAAPHVIRAFDVAAFVDRAFSFLCEREAENCLPLGILAGPRVRQDDVYLAHLESRNVVVGAALMTPPYDLVIAAGTQLPGLSVLVDHLAASGVRVPGVSAPPDLAQAFAMRTGLGYSTLRAPAHVSLEQPSEFGYRRIHLAALGFDDVEAAFPLVLPSVFGSPDLQVTLEAGDLGGREPPDSRPLFHSPREDDVSCSRSCCRSSGICSNCRCGP